MRPDPRDLSGTGPSSFRPTRQWSAIIAGDDDGERLSFRGRNGVDRRRLNLPCLRGDEVQKQVAEMVKAL